MNKKTMGRPTTFGRNISLNIRISPEEKALIDKVAKDNNTTKIDVIMQGIDLLIKQKKKN